MPATSTSPWPQFGGPDRNFIIPPPASARFGKPTPLWQRALGYGTSGIVADGRRLFTMYSVPMQANPNAGEEIVIALDAATGRTLWENRSPVAMRKGQESFSNDPVRPQATPVLASGRVYTLGFTGLLKCFDVASGRLLWERDLVAAFEATPVQFGFSASPLIHRGNLIVHMGGKQAALVAFDPKNGAVRWKSEPAEPSYASPIVLPTEAGDELVQVTRDGILGVDARTGQTRWRYTMPKTGLTNVPTPLVLPGQRLLVSGQGLLGTRLLQIAGSSVSEVWSNAKATFFYCNWAASAEFACGSVGSFFVGLRLADGKELWRERGQEEANLIRVGDETLLLRGDGRLTRCQIGAAGLTTGESFPLLQSRSWTAPTLVANTLYARDEKEICAVRVYEEAR